MFEFLNKTIDIIGLSGEPIKFLKGGKLLLAPNKKPSNLNAEQHKLVRTSAFKKWYGDWENPKTKGILLDKNKEPLVLWRGDSADFKIFENEKTMCGRFWFTPHKWYAETRGRGGATRPFFIKSNEIIHSDLNGCFVVPNDNPFAIHIVPAHDLGGNENHYIIFNPNQIKLADGTNTTFDGSNPDIRKEKGGEIDDVKEYMRQSEIRQAEYEKYLQKLYNREKINYSVLKNVRTRNEAEEFVENNSGFSFRESPNGSWDIIKRMEEGGQITTPDEQLIIVEPSVYAIMKELSGKGHQALIIGGAVRDALLGIEPKDIDVEVYKISYSDLSDFLAKFGKVDLVGKTFGVIKFHPRGSEMSYDFSVPRKENKIGIGHTSFAVTFDENTTIADAGERRDFTFNAIGYDPIENKIYDYFGGLKDLGNKVIRHTSKAFSEDPLRILRAMQFQARFDFTIHPDTIALIREMLKTNDFNDLSKERIYEEWMKWAAKGVRHDYIFKFLRDTTLIDYYPELKLLKETPQDKIYHPEGDVEIHTEMTLREMDELLIRDNIVGEEKAILVMSILLHDIAKPQCTKEEMKRERMTITSHGHEAMGGSMCLDFLPRLGFPESFYLPVANLVANHLAGVSIASIPSRSGKLKAVKKLSRRLYPATIRQLLYVMDADNYGRGTERKEATGKAELLELSAEADVQTKAYQPILMGRHLIELGLKPSPQFREILAKGFEAQENGEFSDVEGGKVWLKDYLKNTVDKF